MSFNQKENQTLQEGDIFNLHKTPFDKEEYEPVEIVEETKDYFLLENEKKNSIWVNKGYLLDGEIDEGVTFTANLRFDLENYNLTINVLFN